MIGFDQHFLVYDLVNYFKFQSFQPANSDLMLEKRWWYYRIGGIGVISTFFSEDWSKKTIGAASICFVLSESRHKIDPSHATRNGPSAMNTHWKRIVIFTGAKSASVQPGEWRSSSYTCRARCGKWRFFRKQRWIFLDRNTHTKFWHFGWW